MLGLFINDLVTLQQLRLQISLLEVIHSFFALGAMSCRCVCIKDRFAALLLEPANALASVDFASSHLTVHTLLIHDSENVSILSLPVPELLQTGCHTHLIIHQIGRN